MAASCTNVDICGSAACPAQLSCLTDRIFPRLVIGLILFVGVVTLAMIIFAGFRYITSQADKKTIDSANKTLFYAVVGLFFVLFSFFILNIIGYATGVTCLEPSNFLNPSVGLFNACK